MPGIGTDRLSQLGFCRYNGHDFTSYAETVSISGTPVYDQAGRTVVYTQWSITIKDRMAVLAGTSLDATIQQVKNRLMVPGGEFIYTNHGFGSLEINTAGSDAKDVMWGPKPRSFSYRMLGRDLAGEITWSVEVCLPQCATPQYELHLMEACYSVSWSTDASGYTQRSITGYIKIPQTRASVDTRTLASSADEYRERIVPEVPHGFRRDSSSFTLDESKCRLNFTFSDSEMPPNAPPPRCIQASADHSASSSRDTAFSQWVNTLSANYEMAKGVPASAAIAPWMALLKSRVGAAKNNGGQPFLLSISFRELNFYDRARSAFSASWRVLSTIAKVVEACGLWTPVPDSNYNAWRASLSGSIFSRTGRGHGNNQKFNVTDDVIVDLCSGSTVAQSATGAPPAELRVAANGVVVNPWPAPESSWLDYQNQLLILQDDQVVQMKPMASSIPTQNQENTTELRGALPVFDRGNVQDVLIGAGIGFAVGGVFGGVLGGMLAHDRSRHVAGFQVPSQGGRILNRPQRRADPTIEVLMVGKALRAGHIIDAPRINSIGGVIPVPCNDPSRGDHFVSCQVAVKFGVPVFAARWQLRWALPVAPPGGIGLPNTYTG